MIRSSSMSRPMTNTTRIVTKAMEQAGVAPAVIYAFRKTGRIITEENAKFVPAAALEEWQHAIAEYEELIIEDQETEPQ